MEGKGTGNFGDAKKIKGIQKKMKIINDIIYIKKNKELQPAFAIGNWYWIKRYFTEQFNIYYLNTIYLAGAGERNGDRVD